MQIKSDTFHKMEKNEKEDDEVILVDVMDKKKQMKARLQLHFPTFILMITMIQGILFMASFMDCNLKNSYWIQAKFWSDPCQQFELWKVIVYSFIVISIQGLIGTLPVQLIIGIPLEILQSSKTVAKIYFAGILGGALAIGIFDRKSYVFGPSAGIWALKMTWFGFSILNWASLKLYHLFILFFLTMFMFLENVFLEDPEASAYGHFGGAIIGLLASLYFLKPYDDKRWKRILGFISIFIVVCFVFASFITNLVVLDLDEGALWRRKCMKTMMKYSIGIRVDQTDNLTTLTTQGIWISGTFNLTAEDMLTESREYYADVSGLNETF